MFKGVLVILQAKCLETGETVAIKKVLQDKRYKNRELQTMRLLDHPNVVSLKHCFFSTTDKDELYLNLVLEYVPETVYRVTRHYSKANQRMPMIYVKLYTYQVSQLFLICSCFDTIVMFGAWLFIVYCIISNMISKYSRNITCSLTVSYEFLQLRFLELWRIFMA